MFTVIRHHLPIKDSDLRVKLSDLFAEAMNSEPIYSYWIPATIRRKVLTRIFRERLSIYPKGGYAILSSDHKSAAILSYTRFSSWAWIRTIWLYIKCLPIRFWINWFRLIAVSYGLRKHQIAKEVFYLEAIATEVNSRRQGFASNILESIEELADESCSSVICETHDGSLKGILEVRGWNEIELLTVLMRRLGVRFMIYQNPYHNAPRKRIA